MTAQVTRLLSAASLGQAVAFNAPEQALPWCLANHPPVVLLDFSMPGMDGLEFLKRLKSHPPTAGTAVGIMTGWETDTLRIRAAEVGAAGVISKPLDEDEFCAFMLMLKGAAMESAVQLESSALASMSESASSAGDRHTVNLSRLIHEASSILPLRRVADRKLLRRVVLLLAETQGVSSQEIDMLDAALRRTFRLVPSRRQADLMLSWDVVDEHRTKAQRVLATAALELLSAREPDALKYCAQMVIFSGERWDGSGGPLGIRGVAIPFSARVFGLAQRFVTFADARPVTVRTSADGGCAEVLGALQVASGHDFDPSLLRALAGIAPRALQVHQTGVSHCQDPESSTSSALVLSPEPGRDRS